jgi:drug/metabolite transporter (DMT)-like permease
LSAVPSSHPSAARARLQILAAALLFSTGGAVIKGCSLTAWQVAGFRSAVAAGALYFVIPGGRTWWHRRALCVGLAYAATMVLFVSANKLTTAANTIFLQSTAPMYLLLLGPWLLGERVERSETVQTAFLALGLVLLFIGGQAPQVTAPQPVAGNALAATSGVCWALTLLGLRWLGRDEETAGRGAGGAIVAGNLIAAAVSAPFALPVAHGRPLDWALVGYLGVFQIGLAYLLMSRGMRHVPALQAALVILVEPVLNAVWAWLIHGERPGTLGLAGCGVILAATAGGALRRKGAPVGAVERRTAG